jgi:hypothetical protein
MVVKWGLSLLFFTSNRISVSYWLQYCENANHGCECHRSSLQSVICIGACSWAFTVRVEFPLAWWLGVHVNSACERDGVQRCNMEFFP